jgi:hypothetical protein
MFNSIIITFFFVGYFVRSSSGGLQLGDKFFPARTIILTDRCFL